MDHIRTYMTTFEQRSRDVLVARIYSQGEDGLTLVALFAGDPCFIRRATALALNDLGDKSFGL